MKIREWIFIVVGVFLFILFISSRVENSEMRSEIEKLEGYSIQLQQQVDKLNGEIDKYKNSPDRLIAQAKEWYRKKDISQLELIHTQLEKYHRSSKEYSEVGTYLSVLKDAEAKRIADEKAAKLIAVKRLKKKHDDVSGVTWYENPYFNHYTNSNHTSIYMGQSEKGVWLRLLMSYHGDDWIFFKNAYLSYDGNTMEIPFDDYRDKKTENSTSVWEWIDVTLTGNQIDFLKKFVKGKSLKMRLSGKYAKTKSISLTERKAIRDVLLGYEVLKNEISSK